MEVETTNYVCSICGKRNVKLWRPYLNATPLVCTKCAEERQVAPQVYEEIYVINLSDVSKIYSSDKTLMVPACPDEDGAFWSYSTIPEENRKWWNALPTK